MSTNKDLSRAVAFLTLPRVQSTSWPAREKFLKGKGFNEEEIAEAKKQAMEILSKYAEAAFPSSSSGGPIIPFSPGRQSSTHVGIGPLSVYSVSEGEREATGGSSNASDGDEEQIVRKQLNDVLTKLEASLQASKSNKASLAVLLIAVPNDVGKHQALVSQIVDDWIDAAHPPTRTIVQSDGGVQVLAVAK